MEHTDQVSPLSSSAFPQKPVLDESSNAPLRSLISIGLFILAWYIFFDRDIISIFILVGVMLIHEAGHFLAMRYYHYQDVKMFFIPLMGAFVSGEKRDVSQKQRAIVIMAGPLPGIIVGLACGTAGIFARNEELVKVAMIFLFLNVFNLLPIKPLDGGALIETLFLHARESLQLIFSILSASAMTGLALYLESYMLLLIPLFTVLRVRNQFKLKKVREELEAEQIGYQKTYEELSDREYWLIREKIIGKTVMFRDLEPGNYTISEHEGRIIQEMKNLLSGKSEPDLSTAGIILFTFLWLLFFMLPVALFIMLYN